MANSLGEKEVPEARQPADVRVEPAWFQAIYRHAAFGISLTSPEDTYLGVNPAYEWMMGYSAGELIGRLLLAITHPGNREASDALNAQMDRGEIDEFSLDKRYICRDGKILYGRLKVSPVDDAAGKMLFKLAMAEDIGELKQRERELEDSETRLLEAQRIADLGSWSVDMAVGETPRVHWSGHLCEIHGIDEKNQPRRFEDYAERIHPEDRQNFVREWMAAFEAREPFESDYRIVRPDGEVRDIHSHAFFVFNESEPGQLRCIGASIDVTERKRTEDSLLASEARLAEAQRIAHMGNWEYVLASGKVTWSDECYKIFGQTQGTFVPSPGSYFCSVHADDREKVKRLLTPERRPRGNYAYEHRIIRLDGEIRHVQH